jgi:phosphatidylserine/phosphatidylglycerophosphate/cardiolipin synthase-like enzyme
MVVVRHESAMYPSTLGSDTSSAAGEFDIPIGEDPIATEFRRHLQLRVVDHVQRVLLRRERQDEAADVLDFGDLELARAEVEGFLATLGTGTPQRVSDGNALDLLIDGEAAFGHVADLIDGAEQSIYVTQLFLNVPEDFAEDPDDELPSMVFRFRDPQQVDDGIPKIGPEDHRPERRLIALSRNDDQLEINILLHRYSTSALSFITVVGFAAWLYFDLFDAKSTSREVRSYFNDASVPRVRVEPFRQFLPDGVMHHKLVIVDGAKAVSLGSPMKQHYFDTTAHAVENLRRGGGSGLPNHDVSVAIEGPAVADLHETFSTFWNDVADDDDRVDDTIDPPSAPAPGGRDVATVQVVRTISERRLDDPADGEKGILEAYLRAIAKAERLVYIENQYFTNDAIATALIEVLRDGTARPDLQVVMLLNINPDVPLYPDAQHKLIARLAAAAAEVDTDRPRLGVFTRWTHELSDPRPRIMPVYVHSKVAVVDDRWATIGSANLDGLSLDFNWLLSKLTFGDARAMETNLVLLNGVDGRPSSPSVDRLRRQLWREHLDTDITAFDQPPDDARGWLGLWADRAEANRVQLKDDPTVKGPGHVLPYATAGDDAETTPRAHLEALEIDTRAVDPIKGTPSVQFGTGNRAGRRRSSIEIDPVP